MAFLLFFSIILSQGGCSASTLSLAPVQDVMACSDGTKVGTDETAMAYQSNLRAMLDDLGIPYRRTEATTTYCDDRQCLRYRNVGSRLTIYSSPPN